MRWARAVRRSACSWPSASAIATWTRSCLQRGHVATGCRGQALAPRRVEAVVLRALRHGDPPLHHRAADHTLRACRAGQRGAHGRRRPVAPARRPARPAHAGDRAVRASGQAPGQEARGGRWARDVNQRTVTELVRRDDTEKAGPHALPLRGGHLRSRRSTTSSSTPRCSATTPRSRLIADAGRAAPRSPPRETAPSWSPIARSPRGSRWRSPRTPRRASTGSRWRPRRASSRWKGPTALERAVEVARSVPGVRDVRTQQVEIPRFRPSWLERLRAASAAADPPLVRRRGQRGASRLDQGGRHRISAPRATPRRSASASTVHALRGRCLQQRI